MHKSITMNSFDVHLLDNVIVLKTAYAFDRLPINITSASFKIIMVKNLAIETDVIQV